MTGGEDVEREFEHRLTETEERSKSNTHRLDDLERRQTDLEKLVATVAVMAERVKNVEGKVDGISADVKTLKGKPAKQWEQLTGQIVTLIVAALVGFVLAKLGI